MFEDYEIDVGTSEKANAIIKVSLCVTAVLFTADKLLGESLYAVILGGWGSYYCDKTFGGAD